MARWLFAMLALLVGCTSIDAEVNEQIRACKEITDEALRVKCFDQIKYGSDRP